MPKKRKAETEVKVEAPPINVDDCEEVSLDSLNTIDDGVAALEKNIADDELGDELDCEETVIDD